MRFVLFVTFLVTAASAMTCPEQCSCRYLDQNNLSFLISECKGPLSLTSSSFSMLQKPKKVKMEGVNIYELGRDAFSGFGNLSLLEIRNSKLGQIDAEAFDSVETVKLNNCLFEDDLTFVSKSLNELHITNSKLTEVPDLTGALNLIILNLTDNHISRVKIDAFATLKDLNEVYISNNNITELPADIFVNNDLNTLYLDNNPLKYFSINTSNELEVLSLKSCKLSNFGPDSTRHLGELVELYLNDNNINELHSSSLSNMPELNILDVSNNDIFNLPAEVFIQNYKLEKIILDGNPLSTLPVFKTKNAEPFNTYLFSCSNCNLKYLNAHTFERFSALETLKLNDNYLNSTEEFLKNLAALKVLDLSGNEISSIGPQAFSTSSSLVEINLSNNKLSALNPLIFINNEMLTIIRAENIGISKLWTNNSVKLDALEQLYVGDNQIDTISVEDLKVVPRLTVLDVHNNPLQCNSATKNMLNWIEERSLTLLLKNVEETHAELNNEIDMYRKPSTWKNLLTSICPDYNDFNQMPTLSDIDDVPENDLNDIDGYTKEDGDDDDEDEDEDDEDDDLDLEELITPRIESNIERESLTISRASYILTLTIVFIFTALIVLCMVLTMALIVMRRNGSLSNMRNANLPRFKIPLWSATTGQKKHSGSIYRPLSEELGPQTPKLSRYEFKVNPTVHSASPLNV